MSRSKKPPAVFQVVFKGPGVYPEKLSIRRVADALSAISRLAAGVVMGDEDEDDDESENEIRLLNLGRQSSAVCDFISKSPMLTLQRLRETGRILQRPEQIGESEYILRPIKDLSAIAASLECTVLVRDSERHEVLAQIEGDSYSKLSKSFLISGNTKITGTVQRVGGVTDTRCALRVPFQHRLLYCRVANNELARKLGDALYEKVVVSGAARWLKHSMRLFSFKVEHVYQTKPGSIDEHLDALWKLGLNDWEKLDNPDKELQDIRGD